MKKNILLLLFLFSIKNTLSQVDVVTDFHWAHPTKVNNKIVFSHQTPDYGKELWVSDGSTTGTMLLKDINTGTADSTPFYFTLLDDVVYFQANSNQIWRTDGTIGGTYMMVNNPQITNPTNFVKTQGFLFFEEGPSNSRTLWKMNTNPNSETLVTPINNFTNIRGISVFDYDNNVILFNAKTLSNGWAIWRSNGGVSLMVKDLYTENLDYEQMNGGKKFGSDFYFNGFSTSSGGELWKTDATLPNTNLIKDIYVDANYFNGSFPQNFIKVGATIYFIAKDITNGYELWKTDGTEVGTQMVKDIYQGNNDSSNSPIALTEFNNKLYFAQSDLTGTGYQIWKTDGSEAGTIKVSTIPNANFTGNEMFAYNNNLYFSFIDSTTGAELWKLDSNDNLSMLSDITPGATGSYPFGFFDFNGYIYFTAILNNIPSGYKTYKIIDQNLYTENSKNNNNFFLYPNPSTNVINIEGNISNNYNIEVYDLIGKQIESYKNEKSIDVSNFISGIYLIKIIDLENNLESTHKIIKN